MNFTFALLAGVTVGAAIAAMSFRNLVHCALCLIGSLAGLALLYLQLGAEFVGLVQILVYVGAVSILIVFAILLTRGGGAPEGRVATGPISGILVAGGVFALLAWAILRSGVRPAAADAMPTLPVKVIGEKLVGDFVLPLQIVGVLLTAAMIGAVVIAMRERVGGGRR
jgi:NADH-quinone oxidoreductase subunit J